MFWGFNLKPNRKYTQTTNKGFHIAQAALDNDGLADDAMNKIYISGEDNQKHLICTLRKNICEQVMLDLNFAEGDTICFQSIGSGNVSLTGYLTIDNPYFGGQDDSEEEEEEAESDLEEELAVLNGDKSKGKNKKKSKKEEEADDEILKAALEDDSNSDSELDDEDEDEEEDENEDDEDEEEEEGESDEDAEMEEIEEPKKKIAKTEKKEIKTQQNGSVQNAQKSKKEKKAEKKQQQQQQQKPSAGGERTLTGGVKVEDIRVGNGPEVKVGKRPQVYYEGRLKSNNKVFDSLKNGTPFKFNVGRGEVIKGWDVGVVGMKVGGKRRITCPPHMAYGARGQPPTIPPNSTLVFDVELKAVN